MRPTLWQSLVQTVRRLVPFVLSVVLVLVAVAPMTTPGFLRAGPMIGLLCVYYWAVHRPDLMGYLGGFLLGILTDILMSTPLGVTSLVLMLTQYVVLTQYRFFVGKPFLITWWALALVALGATLLKALAVAVLTGYVVAPGALAASYGLTLLLYPILAWGFARTHFLLTKES
ncbi:rod shape-determining protein MreD [Roseospira navarrensis]|uniref:Rod shape-determining protein MreD n=1 Tax=Roseospira navarrensis TaxID=140058 RepID=A0A7X1ZFP6_9PROT|nr:rod shape-determining protein MreD [Roseospira navarrensis]MQX37159.1 rod shape-determining protein MreD [Roseospira navarrensis]